MVGPRHDRLREIEAHVSDQRVIAAVRSVDRSLFVPPELRADAWRDGPLPIGSDQTISQPLVVAAMCELLRLTGGERVLDVGTGSGYHAALLAALARHVDTIERHETLAERAQHNLEAAGVENVSQLVGDGTYGFEEGAPYDAINVAAATTDEVVDRLGAQLADGGRLVAPVGGRRGQRLIVLEREGGQLHPRRHGRVRFVPLVSGEPA